MPRSLEDAKGWEPLTGNTNRDRWYFPTLSHNKQLYDEIRTAMAWYVSLIKSQYPGLTIVKYGVWYLEASLDDFAVQTLSLR